VILRVGVRLGQIDVRRLSGGDPLLDRVKGLDQRLGRLPGDGDGAKGVRGGDGAKGRRIGAHDGGDRPDGGFVPRVGDRQSGGHPARDGGEVSAKLAERGEGGLRAGVGLDRGHALTPGRGARIPSPRPRQVGSSWLQQG
jgi:hypothetical protein